MCGGEVEEDEKSADETERGYSTAELQVEMGR